jgi:cysteinyl-tRNA synthetase
MALQIYNTLTRRKEGFEPLQPGKVRMYVCGPTVYDLCHIGHARSVVVFDVIFRYLVRSGFDVTYVRNFTDVDDKIIKRAAELGEDPAALAQRFIVAFYEDMDALYVRRATVEPRVTEHIADIIRVVSTLIDKGMAYVVEGDVYFAVERFPDYGKLSGRRLADMQAGARVEVDTRKRNPFDFALWKAAKPGEPQWDSPWGPGRPGWHIECSAMSLEHLGRSFDIHGGGQDLIFPHHENEIAQSEGAFDSPYARYWIHNGFVNIDQEKMSKSLGNFLTIRDVLKSHHPEIVRLFLLTHHYRNPIDYSAQNMEEASAALDKIYGLLARIESQGGALPREQVPRGALWQQFCDALDDDFNSARGLAAIFEAVRRLNRALDDGSDGKALAAGYGDIRAAGEVLGLFNHPAAEYFQARRQKGLVGQSMDPEAIQALVDARTAARRNREFARADEIRLQLEALKVVLEDRPEGTVWKIKT